VSFTVDGLAQRIASFAPAELITSGMDARDVFFVLDLESGDGIKASNVFYPNGFRGLGAVLKKPTVSIQQTDVGTDQFGCCTVSFQLCTNVLAPLVCLEVHFN
jgi:hypothetical protein